MSIITEATLLDDLDRRTLQLFIDDFEQCGVHLDESKVGRVNNFRSEPSDGQRSNMKSLGISPFGNTNWQRSLFRVQM